jgi:hypothetical protein
VRYAEEEKLRQAFLWKETRTADKAGLFSLLSTRYQVGPELARRKLQVRFDPEALHEIEVWYSGRLAQRVKPFSVTAHRRPKATKSEITPETKSEPTADWLSHLVNKRREAGIVEPHPKQLVQTAQKQREEADVAVVDLLTEKLESGVVDTAAARAFLQRFGPFDLALAEQVIDELIAQGESRDQHVTFYLEAIRKAARGGVR